MTKARMNPVPVKGSRGRIGDVTRLAHCVSAGIQSSTLLQRRFATVDATKGDDVDLWTC